jgi:hypothetical protein
MALLNKTSQQNEVNTDDFPSLLGVSGGYILVGPIVCFISASYEDQALSFGRLSTFYEHPKFKEKIISQEEWETIEHFAGSNIPMRVVRRFLKKSPKAINASESRLFLKLKEICKDKKIQYLISFTEVTEQGISFAGREDRFNLSRYYLFHELSHALFFSSSQYRRLGLRTLRSMSPGLKAYITERLFSCGYDRGVITDEMIAYAASYSEYKFQFFPKDMNHKERRLAFAREKMLTDWIINFVKDRSPLMADFLKDSN